MTLLLFGGRCPLLHHSTHQSILADFKSVSDNAIHRTSARFLGLHCVNLGGSELVNPLFRLWKVKVVTATVTI